MFFNSVFAAGYGYDVRKSHSSCQLMRMTLLLFVIVVVGGVFAIIGTVALCARCSSVLKQRCFRLSFFLIFS